MWKAGGKLPEDTDASLRPMRGFKTVLKQEEVVHSVKTKEMHEHICALFIK